MFPKDDSKCQHLVEAQIYTVKEKSRKSFFSIEGRNDLFKFLHREQSKKKNVKRTTTKKTVTTKAKIRSTTLKTSDRHCI